MRLLSISDRRVARQTFWLGASSGIVLIGGIVQVAITARMLGVEGFGALAAITAFCALVHGLAAIPGGDMVTTFVTRSVTEGRKEEAARIVRFGVALSLGMSLIGYAAIVALAFAATELLGISDNTAYRNAAILFGVVGILNAPSSDSQAVLRLADRVSLGSIVTLLTVLTRVGAIALAWYLDSGLSGVILAHLAGAAVGSAGLLVVAIVSARHAGIEGLLTSASVRVPPDSLRFQAGSFGTSAIGSLNANLDTILVAHLIGTADAGIYRAARTVIDYAKQPFKQLSVAVRVEFSRLWYSNDIAGLRRMVLKLAIICVALALIGFGFLAYVREYIIGTLFGDDFAEVSLPLLIMLVGAFVAAASSPLAALPRAVGRIHPTLVYISASLLVSVTAILLLVPGYGAQGAAWANTLGTLAAVGVLLPFALSVVRGGNRPETMSIHNEVETKTASA